MAAHNLIPRTPLHRAFCWAIVGSLRLLPKRTQAFVRTMHEPVARLDTDLGDVKMLATNTWEQWRLRSCRKEPETVAWLKENLRPDDVLYDIGANIGAYTLLACTIQPTVRCVAVEPIATTYGHLVRNLALNHFSERVQTINVAVGPETRMGYFEVADFLPGTDAVGELKPGSTYARQSVLFVRLDDLASVFHMPPPTLIKADIDGGELALLAGAIETLKLSELRGILIEVDRDGTDSKVIEIIQSAGFKLVHRADKEKSGISNLIFSRF